MPLDATLGIIDKWGYMRNGDYRPTRFESSSNKNGFECGKVLREGVCHGFFIYVMGTDLIFLTNTVQRVLLLIRRIWVKLSIVFTLLLGRSEDISTSRLSRFLNLLSSIDWSRTFNTSSNFLLHFWTVWDGVDGKDSKKLKKYDVEME